MNEPRTLRDAGLAIGVWTIVALAAAFSLAPVFV